MMARRKGAWESREPAEAAASDWPKRWRPSRYDSDSGPAHSQRSLSLELEAGTNTTDTGVLLSTMQHNNISNTAHQPAFPSPASLSVSDGSLPFNLDPYTAKQMAALQATSLAKAGNRSAPGGTSVPYFGGMSMNQPHPGLSRPDAPQELHSHAFGGLPDFQAPNQQPNPNTNHTNPAHLQQQMVHLQHKKRSFLTGLANVMMQRNAPLPPALTGVQYPPGYDSSNSPWKALEISPADIGTIRLVGKDIDLYRLWAIVQQYGGGMKVTQQALWPHILRHLDLPEQFPIPPPSGQHSVASVLANYYMSIIGPFEEAYRRNVQQQQHMQQQRAMLGRVSAGAQQPQSGSSSGQVNGASSMSTSFPSQGGSMQGSAAHSVNMMGMGQSHSASSVQGLESPMSAVGAGQFPSSNIPHTPQLAQHLPHNNVNIAADSRANLGLPSASTPILGSTNVPQHQMRPQSSAGGFPFPGSGQDIGGSDLEHEIENRKRKMRVSEELDTKRVRQKTGSSEASDTRASVGLDRSSVPPSSALNGHASQTSATAAASAPRPQRQPSRRKIEYIPYAREVESAGGRDLEAIQREVDRAARRPLKDMNEWGQVDVEALTMSLRSRISTELSYALTTFTMLTLMRYPQREPGFPIAQSPDLLEEVLELLEDVGFDGAEDDDVSDVPPTYQIKTHRELVNALVEDSTKPFAGLDPRQGSRNPDAGPRQRPGDTVLAVFNILRNLSNMSENQEHLAKHPRLISIVLRLCSLAPSSSRDLPMPASPALSLSDLLSVRKDAIYILVNVASSVSFASSSGASRQALRDARRAFELLSSPLTDPNDAISPFASLLHSGIAPAMHQPKPPSLADVTLEAFTRLFQPDDNRQILSNAVPSQWLWNLMEALVHRLPVSDNDFQVVVRDVWLGYVEKIVMAIYSIAFLASPQLKKRIKTDRQLGFTKVLVRLIRKFAIHVPPEARVHFIVSVRRAIEAMKLIDDAEDLFDTSQSTVPTLMFGMGYGEHGENRVEKGMGLLSGYQEDITWGLMLAREVFTDDHMFTELESLVRVDKAHTTSPA
ncbi:hypothetical protein AcV7_000535 [Taiwanofungus camphoratus]|nr:hypothetical protein AcV7_000535 [Antrodia cinnamomea]